MSCTSSNSTSINETFIIEPLSITGGTPTISACTSVYTNALISCSGNTQILLSTGVILFDGNIYTNNDLSANTINASTFYSGGTNVLDIININNITGGTFDNNTDVLTLNKSNGNIIVTGFTDFYTTGATLIGNTAYFNRNDTLSAYTLDLSHFSTQDIYTTGVTFNNNQLIISRNDGISLNTFINTFTGLTINGLLSVNTISANTISATTFFGDGSNLTGISSITGGTFNNTTDTLTLSNSTGGPIIVTGFTDFYTTGATLINNIVYFNRNDVLSAYTLDLSNLAVSSYITGATFSDNNLILTNNTGGTISVLVDNFSGLTINGDLSVTGNSYSNNFSGNSGTFLNIYGNGSNITGLPYVTGGTYDSSTGIASFTNSTGNTFNVNGFFKPSNDIFSTGLTINNATYDLTITRNDGVKLITNLGILASDVTITGGTYDTHSGVVTFTNNTGGTFTVSGFTTGITDTRISTYSYDNANTFTITDSTGGTFSTSINVMTGLTVNGSLTSTTISATTYQNLPIDITITGGSISRSGNNSNLIFNNNTGGTFTVSSIFDTFVTGGTYSNGTTIFTNNSGNTFSVTGFNTTIDTRTTGFTYNNNTFTINDNSGNTFNANINSVTGLTVNGLLSATTISATTYQNLPIDVRVTGGTPDNINHLYTFTNNTGGTFSVSGLNDIYVTGGTYNNVTGISTFTNNTGGTFNVSGFSTTTDTYVTGFTYNNNLLSITNNTGGTLSVLVNIMTGLTVNGNIIVTGNTNLNGTLNVTGNTVVSGLTSTTFTNGSTLFPTAVGVSDILFATSANTIGSDNNFQYTAFDPANGGRGLYINAAASANTGNNFTLGNYTGGGGVTVLNSPTLLGAIVMRFQNGGNVFDITSDNSGVSGFFGGRAFYIGNPTAATAKLQVGGPISLASWGTVGVRLALDSSTFTDTSVSGTRTSAVSDAFNRPTFTASNTAVTITNAATVYIAGTPISGANVSFTNAMSLWVASGLTRFDDNVSISGLLSATTISASSITANTISAITYLGLPIDVRVTGGTYSNGTSIFTNNTGGTFSITGFNTTVDTYTTAFTYNNNTFTITNSTGGTFNATINSVTGLTVNGLLSATTISASSISASSISATSFNYKDGNQALAKVLTSDINGNATWQYPSVGGVLAFFFQSGASDVATYDYMYQQPQTQATQQLTYTLSVPSTQLVTFVTISGTPGMAFYPSGTVNFYIDADQSAGSQSASLVFGMYKRTTGGTETLVGISSPFGLNGSSRASYYADMPINSFTANTTDRIVVKVSATTSGGGSNPTIDLYLAGTSASRVEMPSYAANITNFVPYTGATSNVNLGVYNLTGDTLIANDIRTPTTGFSNTILGFSNVNNYAQINVQNQFAGSGSSSDLVATSDNGNENINYVDVGINSSLFNTNYIGGANDAYLYSTGKNLLIGNVSTGQTIVFFTDSSNVSASTRLTISSATTISTTPIYAPTLSATTYLNLPTDIRVTGGTYTAGTATFTNNTGGTFSVSGFSIVHTTAFTYNNNTFTITDSSNSAYTATINSVTGLTINGTLTATTITATTVSASTLSLATLTANQIGFGSSANTLTGSSFYQLQTFDSANGGRGLYINSGVANNFILGNYTSGIAANNGTILNSPTSTGQITFRFQNGANIFSLVNNGVISGYSNTRSFRVGNSSPAFSTFQIAGGLSDNISGTTGLQLGLDSGVYSNNTASTGITTSVVTAFNIPSFATGATSALTITNAATVYIGGAPSGGTNVTITNPMSLWVASGTTRLDGGLTASTISASTISAQTITGLTFVTNIADTDILYSNAGKITGSANNVWNNGTQVQTITGSFIANNLSTNASPTILGSTNNSTNIYGASTNTNGIMMYNYGVGYGGSVFYGMHIRNTSSSTLSAGTGAGMLFAIGNGTYFVNNKLSCYATQTPNAGDAGMSNSAYGFQTSLSGTVAERFTMNVDKFGIGTTTPTAYLDIPASNSAVTTTINASMRIRSGTTVTNPNQGDIWNNGTNLVWGAVSGSSKILAQTSGGLLSTNQVAVANANGDFIGSAGLTYDGAATLTIGAASNTTTLRTGGGAAFMYTTSSLGTVIAPCTLQTVGIADQQNGNPNVFQFYCNSLSGVTMGVGVIPAPGTQGKSRLDITGSTSSLSALRIRSGSTVTTPAQGDIWNDNTSLKINFGRTKTFQISDTINIANGYTANTNDFGSTLMFTGTTGGTVTLPLISTTFPTGIPIYVKDAGFSAGTNTITIASLSPNLIDGLTSATITTRAGALGFITDGTNWFIRDKY